MGNKIINIGDVKVGTGEKILIAGPCAVESKEQIFEVAKTLSRSGVKFLRGGVFKPRTSPHSFQGLGEEGLLYLNEAAKMYGMITVSEIMSTEELKKHGNDIDVIQVGARNMYNYSLLRELGKLDKPILLKRGFSATYQEWALAAEYIIKGGNDRVILCERGIRTFERGLRFTLDISAVPYMKKLTGLPVIVDPSHAAGERWVIPSLSKAALAVGADGVMVEVHPSPENALSDGKQSLVLNDFDNFYSDIKGLLGE